MQICYQSVYDLIRCMPEIDCRHIIDIEINNFDQSVRSSGIKVEITIQNCEQIPVARPEVAKQIMMANQDRRFKELFPRIFFAAVISKANSVLSVSMETIWQSHHQQNLFCQQRSTRK